MKKAFVIQAVGSPGSDTRRRADRVFEKIIRPACAAADYEAIRANDEHVQTIVEPIISALNTHPLVIADLAGPPWNLNVLMEVGFRLATGRPIVFLADVDPKPEIPRLQSRKVFIHIIDSAAPTPQDVASLTESIKKYGPEVNYWESDYPTIEFSLSPKSPDGGRFIYANQKAAKVYGLQDADELIGKSINDRDSMLLKFIPDEHRTEFLQEQKRLVGAIYYREEGSRKAAVPLWFTEHTDPCEKDKIYWPVLVQYRFAPEEQNTIVMRVIYVDVSDWDAMAPPPRQPPQVLRLPALFREGRQLASYDHDLFLSYNSKDQEYVKELYQGLRDFGFKVWFDQTDLKGKSLVQELLDATSRSRILCFVVGKNQMGEWQKNAELQPHLKGHLFGKKPFLVLLLDDIDDPKTWTKSLPSALQSVFENVLYLQLPPLGGFREHLSSEMSSKFVVRAIKFIVNVIRDGT